MWGSELSQQWENFFGILFFSLWAADLAGIGFDFIMIAPLLPSRCSFLSLDVWYLFLGGFQCPSIYGCLAELQF